MRFTILAAALLVTFAAGCSGDDAATPGTLPASATTGGAATTVDPAMVGEITVSAAASLTEPFTAIGSAFADAHPGAEVTFTFDSSGALATQIESGAPVDVFASADTTNMDRLVTGGLVEGDATVFARNRLAIVVKAGNPKQVSGLGDLADVGVVALCADTAPCGKYAAEVLGRARVTIPEDQVTRGQNAKATLSAVGSGDADAGIVYVTDVATSTGVEAVDIPDDDNAVVSYPIGVVAASARPEIARAFVEFVAGAEGQALLGGAGFSAP